MTVGESLLTSTLSAHHHQQQYNILQMLYFPCHGIPLLRTRVWLNSVRWTSLIQCISMWYSPCLMASVIVVVCVMSYLPIMCTHYYTVQ